MRINAGKYKEILNMGAWEILIVCFLVLYPLRHAACGADLWDAGYNCANFVNAAPDRMSSVWFFSTYLSNLAGHFFTLLPGGDTFLGINVYTGLVISAGVLISYFFFTRKIGMNRWAAAFSLILMMSLCYSPTPILYGHLSNVLFTISVICIYTALTDDKRYLLVLAGFILGLNIFVRFSNLTQAGLILAVWVYYFINRKDKGREACGGWLKATLFCIGGYLAALFILLIVIHTGYGYDSYFKGVAGLFKMDEGAGYYTFSYMLTDMIRSYLKGIHRLLYIAFFSAAACLAGRMLDKRVNPDGKGKNGRKAEILTTLVIVLVLLAVLMIRGLIKFSFYHYAVTYNTAALLLDIVMILAVLTLVSPGSENKTKLLSILVLLQLILTSVGSNTGISVTMNSMYLSAPYLILKLTEITGGLLGSKEHRVRIPLMVFDFALLVFIVQSIAFGMVYVYQEGDNTGRRDSYVTGNRVLDGIRMSSDRAALLQDMTDCINEEGLAGHDSIVYGFVPAIAYYLDMPSVISSWPDLASYNYNDMKADIDRVSTEAEEGTREYPAVIIGHLLEVSGIEENPKKTDLIYDFIKDHDYVMIHSNDTFEIWRR